MNNHQHLIEVVVGKILDKYDVNVDQTLTSTEKVKVKGTVLDIQAEVEKFLSNLDMDMPSLPTLDTTLMTKSLTNKLTSKEAEVEESYVVERDPSTAYGEPVAKIKQSKNSGRFVNRRKF
ncbi:hypothetical protein MKY91_10865 [Alkalicoccobacillus gibsonii]|uniref:Uncharacterized protein n=1 Tax=Alkalicoccobacillus gibsonii TaxID=79881 RepID=A0ABU9VIE3_9BACI